MVSVRRHQIRAAHPPLLLVILLKTAGHVLSREPRDIHLLEYSLRRRLVCFSVSGWSGSRSLTLFLELDEGAVELVPEGCGPDEAVLGRSDQFSVHSIWTTFRTDSESAPTIRSGALHRVAVQDLLVSGCEISSCHCGPDSGSRANRNPSTMLFRAQSDGYIHRTGINSEDGLLWATERPLGPPVIKEIRPRIPSGSKKPADPTRER